MSKRVMTSEQDVRALQLSKEGWSAAMIAREFGVDSNAVERSLHRQGLGRLPRNGYRKYATSPEVIKQMVAMYEAGESCEAIAKVFNIPWLRVNRRLKQAGVQLRPGGFRHGENHHGWVGGRHVNPDGYVYVWLRPDDPFFSMAAKGHGEAGGYVLEQRLVMARHLGRLLRADETVHHKDNRDRQNNALDNLQLRIGQHGKGASFRCADCGSCNIEPVPILDGPEVS